MVIRYAVTELGFSFGDIVLYSWSIGESLQGPQHGTEAHSIGMDTVFENGKRDGANVFGNV